MQTPPRPTSRESTEAMVLNIGRLRSGLIDDVEADIAAVVEAAGDHVVKVILETAYLTDDRTLPSRATGYAFAADDPFGLGGSSSDEGGGGRHGARGGFQDGGACCARKVRRLGRKRRASRQPLLNNE